MNDMRTRISTLWVVIMFNMVFADILSFIMPGALQGLSTGPGGVAIAPRGARVKSCNPAPDSSDQGSHEGGSVG